MAGGEKEDDRQSIARGKRKEPDVQATGCSNNVIASSNATMSNSDQASVLPTPSVRNQSSFTAVCPVCKKEKECSMIIMNHIVLCRQCNEFYLATERKSLPPRPSTTFQSQFPTRMDASSSVNVPSMDRFQYEYALKNPKYFKSLLESLLKAKNRHHVVPVLDEKELNLHRIFAEVTSRGGILKVTREGRLPEVCATIDENLRDVDLHYLYMQLLYDIETMLCSFLTNSPSNSSAVQHPMQGLVARNPPTPSETASPVSNLRGEQYPSQWIQASVPCTSSAPVNNNQQMMSQWIRPSALYTSSETVNINQQLAGQPILAAAPYASATPVNSYQQLARQPIRASALYTSAVPLNINQQSTRQPIRTSVPYTNSAVNNNQQLTRQPIRAPTPYTNSAAANYNQQLPGSSSGPRPMQMMIEGQPSSSTLQSPRYLTDDPLDFPSADERVVQPLQQMLEVPDVGSTGIHGRNTSGTGMFHSHPWEHAGEAEQSNSETGSSSPLAGRKQS